MSVVADTNSYAMTRTADKPRVNVAASRAQDQLWVFHTVDPTTLHAGDERRALIQYAEDAADRPRREANLFELAESAFERDVMIDLLDRGYRIEPQYQVGAYRIDMVVHVAPGERLAVECDGDQFHGPEQWDNDIRRQRVLERIGWTFFRVRASQYYLDREMPLAPFWERLEQMKTRAASRGPAHSRARRGGGEGSRRTPSGPARPCPCR